MSSPIASPHAAPPSAPPLREITRKNRFVAPAGPDRVFPLLCPVREFDWIPHWQTDVLHSASGVAEEDCVFRTNFPDAGPMTWVVSRYEPPVRIEFTCFVPDHYVFRLRIVLAAVAGGTQLTWTRRWLALGPAGEAFLAAGTDEAFETKNTALERLLVHYLRTGEMLRP